MHGEIPYNYGSTSELYVADMLNDTVIENMQSAYKDWDRVEEPNLDAQRFFGMLDAHKHPQYRRCRKGHSPLASSSRFMTVKLRYILVDECVEAMPDFVKDILFEDNVSPISYYEVQKL